MSWFSKTIEKLLQGSNQINTSGTSNKSNNSITVNGTSYNVQGNSISIRDGKVIVDGVDVTTLDPKATEVLVKFEGSLASLDCVKAEVTGEISNGVDCTNLTCNDIKGNVDATNVRCHHVFGDVDSVNYKELK